MAAAVLVSFVTVYLVGQLSAPPKEVAKLPQQPSESLRPSLDCGFQAFMHSSTAVYFYFDVVLPEGETPRFYERAFVSADGARTTFDGDHRPIWTYGLDGDAKPTITSSDGATRIVLYGLKLGSPGILPIEAGMRSNVYRNLGGTCRQTNLGGSGH
ncbi:hypothetical protein [Hyphomicrobium sp.]|uniref:hypothetical protein n=1 Tax=Hyphomicrobium sp. TaxID=82 RepID=UPI0025C704EA|nr:hypothetical protein [Hyphomicrobium sp.]